MKKRFFKRLVAAYLLMSFIVLGAVAQVTVKGTIKENSGAPLIGATVMIKGTVIGTVSDLEGKWKEAEFASVFPMQKMVWRQRTENWLKVFL